MPVLVLVDMERATVPASPTPKLVRSLALRDPLVAFYVFVGQVVEGRDDLARQSAFWMPILRMESEQTLDRVSS